MHTQNYMEVLEQSLRKKLDILNCIVEKNNVQRSILMEKNVDPDVFGKSLEQKAVLIDQLNELDEGFTQVYDRVKSELQREEQKERVRIFQELITQIMEKSTLIQVQEQRNRELAEGMFSNVRQKIRSVKQSSKAVNQYYKNMGKPVENSPQFLDRKK